MLTDEAFELRAVACEDFDIAADFWQAMRQEVGISDDDLPPDWKPRFVEYFTRRHAAGELMWFFARRGQSRLGAPAG